MLCSSSIQQLSFAMYKHKRIILTLGLTDDSLIPVVLYTEQTAVHFYEVVKNYSKLLRTLVETCQNIIFIICQHAYECRAQYCLQQFCSSVRHIHIISKQMHISPSGITV